MSRDPKNLSFRRGFTLLELMVVVIIIMVLVLVTVPSVKGILHTAELAQADNLMRASLMAARAYAMQNTCVSAVRFQRDGKIVICYGEQVNAGSYSEPPRYRLRAVEGLPPEQMPGEYRAATIGSYEAPVYVWDNLNETQQEAWLNWLREGMFFPLVVFNADGRFFAPECVCEADWYPSSEGDFGRYVGWTYIYRSNSSTSPYTGPIITPHLRLFYVPDFTAYTGDNIWTIIAGTKETDAVCLLSLTTGMIIRTRTYQTVQYNEPGY